MNDSLAAKAVVTVLFGPIFLIMAGLIGMAGRYRRLRSLWK
jgi:hypothetical protein